MEAREEPAGPSGRSLAAEEWQADYFKAIPELEQLARRVKKPLSLVILRSSQLDAGRLDSELTGMLQEQFMKAFSLVQPRILNALRPELSLLLDFLIFRFSVWTGKPTPGSALMNLRYRNEAAVPLPASSRSGPTAAAQIGGRTGVEGPGLTKWQRASWGLAFVFGRYLWGRLDSVAAAYHWGDQPEGCLAHNGWRVMQAAETGFKLASLANFFVFLRYGKYRNLVERLIRSRLVYQRASMPRALSFEYLNRQLVWHELSELLLFLLPLINVSRVKGFIMANLPHIYRPLPSSSEGVVVHTPEERHWCNICHTEDMAVPFVALPCEHKFCYYCLRSHTEAEPGFKCPACGTVIRAMRRWRPAVD